MTTEEIEKMLAETFADATIENLRKCRALGKRMVIGTTGLTQQQQDEITSASQDCALVFVRCLFVFLILLRSATIPVGSSSINVLISPVSDGVSEGLEDVTLTLTQRD